MSNQEDSSVLNKLASRIKPQATWKDLSSLPRVEATKLHDIADRVRRSIRVGHEVARGGRCSDTIVLFSGPTGTGKTMVAEVLARELKVDLYRVDLSLVISKYIGETEKNLDGILAAARRTSAVLFFDEADALFGKRTGVRDADDRYANMDVTYLLQRIEDYAGLAILATNNKKNLDPAFVRHVQYVVEFPLSHGKVSTS
jgi:SpoVK/Ycf46/Vps4 family AAA+-type ATPase